MNGPEYLLHHPLRSPWSSWSDAFDEPVAGYCRYGTVVVVDVAVAVELVAAGAVDEARPSSGCGG